ncbi:hypothetical protein thsps117_24460 [Pseudomonas sp. No.117]
MLDTIGAYDVRHEDVEDSVVNLSAEATGWSFGPFLLLPHRQQLLKDNVPVSLGGRAMELLGAMVAQAGVLLTKQELLTRAWPHAFVEECNLRAQMVAIRRLLAEHDPGTDYIVTVPGRGYRFVMPVATCTLEPDLREATPALGGALELFGVDTLLPRLLDTLAAHRLLTLSGPAGAGKTVIAQALGRTLSDALGGRVYLVDVGDAVNAEVPGRIALRAQGVAPGTTLEDLLARPLEEFLLILDGCDQVLGGMALFVERLLEHCLAAKVVVTSREPLGALGEVIERIPPLAFPLKPTPPDRLSWADFPALALFERRVRAVDATFQLDEGNLAIVRELCVRLHGNPLALELAAARVPSFGLARLLSLLETDFRLDMRGRRTAIGRHRSLQAALEWTYDRLSDQERAIMNLLALQGRPLPLDALTSSLPHTDSVGGDLLLCVESLIEKSWLIADSIEGSHRYLLDSTVRAFVLRQLRQRLDEPLSVATPVASLALRSRILTGYANAGPTSYRVEAWPLS